MNCDGSGFLYDDATNTAYDCRCRPQIIALAKARSLSAVIPRRYSDVSFDRPPAIDIDPQIVAATRRFADRIDEKLDAGRGLWFMGPVGTGKTTLAMLVSKAALKAGRSVAIYSNSRRSRRSWQSPRTRNRHDCATGGLRGSAAQVPTPAVPCCLARPVRRGRNLREHGVGG